MAGPGLSRCISSKKMGDIPASYVRNYQRVHVWCDYRFSSMFKLPSRLKPPGLGGLVKESEALVHAWVFVSILWGCFKLQNPPFSIQIPWKGFILGGLFWVWNLDCFFKIPYKDEIYSHLLSVEGRDAFKLGYIGVVEFDLFFLFLFLTEVMPTLSCKSS